MARVSPQGLKRVYDETGPKGLMKFITESLKKKEHTTEDFSFRDLALITGAIDPYNEESSLRNTMAYARPTERVDPEVQVRESHTAWERQRANRETSYLSEAMHSNLFPVVSTELISNMIIEGYNTGVYVGDQLVTNLPGQRVRNQKVAGFTSLGGPSEVKEGHPYEETGFDEKWIVTSETKKGRKLSVTEEAILFDQTSMIRMKAMTLGEYLRQDREKLIIQGVVGSDTTWRPSGTGETLYATDNTNKNWIGSGGSTGYSSAVALTNWTSLDTVAKFRATQITDDRVDGTAQPITVDQTGLTLLVPVSLAGTAKSIVNAGMVMSSGDTTASHTPFQYVNPIAGMIGSVVSSPYIDQLGGQYVNDWYVGNFKKQFYWFEIWPVQTFTQGADSEAAYDRDVIMSVKARFYGGITAMDTVHVTKVDGA